MEGMEGIFVTRSREVGFARGLGQKVSLYVGVGIIVSILSILSALRSSL
jgi:hypothetical protein